MVLKAILFTKSASEEEVKSASEGEVTSAILFTKSASEEEVISASEEKVKSAILFTKSATAEVKNVVLKPTPQHSLLEPKMLLHTHMEL